MFSRWSRNSNDVHLEEGREKEAERQEIVRLYKANEVPAMEETPTKKTGVVSKTGFAVLCLLVIQNSSKTLLLRYIMRDKPDFLTSAAVFGSEIIKLVCSIAYILCVEQKTVLSIFRYLKEDMRNTLLLAAPASAYCFNMSMEYVALAHLDAAVFSVAVQAKLLFTALMAVIFMRKRLKLIQFISLVLLTVGVMLCNLDKLQNSEAETDLMDNKNIYGLVVTISIALSSGFASVYTERVIKGRGAARTVSDAEYGLAYTQVQLAIISIVAIVIYAIISDFKQIAVYGWFHNFTPAVFLSIVSSAVGGLIVAGVLKYADSVLKGYATATSVALTGVLSMVLFHTPLSILYFLGIIIVGVAVILYNGQDLDQLIC